MELEVLLLAVLLLLNGGNSCGGVQCKIFHEKVE